MSRFLIMAFHIHLDLVSTQCTFIESYLVLGPALEVVNEPRMLPALWGEKEDKLVPKSLASASSHSHPQLEG